MSSNAADDDHALPHVPVLLQDVLSILQPVSGGVIVDGTFGAGGYSRALLHAGTARVVAIDRDPNAVAAGQLLAAEFAGRLDLVHAPFSDLENILERKNIPMIDGLVLDIGVSSMQLDRPERGFSFQHDGPLDMRMAQSGPSAADLINTAEVSVLAKLLWTYGEEKHSRRIASAIAKRRMSQPFERTHELAELIADVVPRPKRGAPGAAFRHPATKTFQALRIAVNCELDELVQVLFAAERVLNPGGRLVVVSFHSLEDRIVKRFLRNRSDARPRGSRHLPETAANAPSFQIVNLTPVRAGEEEVNANPRARSAVLRAGQRTAAPAHPADERGLGLPTVSF